MHYIENGKTHIDFIKLRDSCLSIEGYMVIFGEVNIQDVVFTVNGQEINTSLVNRERNVFSLGNLISSIVAFSAEIPLISSVKFHEIRIHCRINGGHIIEKRNISFGQFSPIGKEFNRSYYYKEGYKLTTKGATICVEECGAAKHIVSEMQLLHEIWKMRKYKKYTMKVIAARCAYKLIKPLIRKEKWLISDRLNKADDNGEVFFNYVSKKKDRKIKCYFSINNSASDISRLKKTGKVIEFRGWRYLLYILFGAITISSHADDLYINPFQGAKEYFRDLLHDTRYVFLQHGVTKDNISGWLNKYNKDFDIFITATNQEYNSMFIYNYYFNKSQVKLTGFPRYDVLYNNPKRFITIVPTWRNNLATLNSEGIWSQKENFQYTQYYAFYNGLLNNTELLLAAKEYNYTICFLPHPNMQQSLHVFNRAQSVVFFDLLKSYREVFAESDMIITDYSSVAFDFAYLRKPLIYCQFDREDFFSGEHTYTKGYFDYERDGFGEVETTLEGTVARIIEYMQNGCILREKYQKRIESTFAYNDKSNCERVYNAIKGLE